MYRRNQNELRHYKYIKRWREGKEWKYQYPSASDIKKSVKTGINKAANTVQKKVEQAKPHVEKAEKQITKAKGLVKLHGNRTIKSIKSNIKEGVDYVDKKINSEKYEQEAKQKRQQQIAANNAKQQKAVTEKNKKDTTAKIKQYQETSKHNKSMKKSLQKAKGREDSADKEFNKTFEQIQKEKRLKDALNPKPWVTKLESPEIREIKAKQAKQQALDKEAKKYKQRREDSADSSTSSNVKSHDQYLTDKYTKEQTAKTRARKQQEETEKKIASDKQLQKEYNETISKLKEHNPLPSLAIKDRATSDGENIAAVNPNKSNKQSEGTCAIAYDLRKRGYDVEVKDTDEAMSFKDIYDCYNKVNKDGKQTFKASMRASVKSPLESTEKYQKSVDEELTSNKNGSRGVVSIKKTGDDKETNINWEVKNGKVTYIDAKNNKTYSSLSEIDPEANMVKYFRTDNLSPNDSAGNCVQNKKKKKRKGYSK